MVTTNNKNTSNVTLVNEEHTSSTNDTTENNNNTANDDDDGDPNVIIVNTLSDSDDNDADSRCSPYGGWNYYPKHVDKRTNIIKDKTLQKTIWKKIISSATLREKESNTDYIQTFMPMNQWYDRWSNAIFEQIKQCMLKPDFITIFMVAIRGISGNHYTLKEYTRLQQEIDNKLEEMDQQCYDAGLTDYTCDGFGMKRFTFEDLEIEMEDTMKGRYTIITTCPPRYLAEAAKIINASPVKDQFILITTW